MGAKHIHPLRDSEPRRWLIKSVKAEGLRQLGSPAIVYYAQITTRGVEPGFPLEWEEYGFTFRAPWKRGPAVLRAALLKCQGFSESGGKARAQEVRAAAEALGAAELK